MKYLLLSSLLFIQSGSAIAATPAIDELLVTYNAQGDALRGEQLWTRKFPGSGQYRERSCASCHTGQLTNTGKHIRTGKSILPLAPSANADSMTDKKKIEKWLLRNCKWTLGRECNVQEKSDLLSFMGQQ